MIYFTIRYGKNQSNLLGIGVQLLWWYYEWKKFRKNHVFKKKLEELDQDLIKIKSKNSFLKFFLKSLVLALIFLFIGRYTNLKNESKIMVFVGVFVLSNILQTIFTSKKQKEEIEKINKEQIKIQAEIFSLVKDSNNWNNL